VKAIIGQCIDLKEAYYQYRTISTRDCPDNPWRFQSGALFSRLDAFLERCHDTMTQFQTLPLVLDLVQTMTQFQTLRLVEIGGTKGKTLTSSFQTLRLVEIGGTKGKTLTSSILTDFEHSLMPFRSSPYDVMNATSLVSILTDFEHSLMPFRSSPYDVMNVDLKQFEEHFYNFRLEVNELERRLASVIIQLKQFEGHFCNFRLEVNELDRRLAFEDSTTVVSSCKLLDSFESFEGLLERDILHHDGQQSSLIPLASLHAAPLDSNET
ncbi:hypothetical protein T484DRAFT_1766399, partial [Baffinella frigidus]